LGDARPTLPEPPEPFSAVTHALQVPERALLLSMQLDTLVVEQRRRSRAAPIA
jgi:hypothetical protein